jgi:hypothetical protein
VDDELTANRLVSRAGDEPVSLPLAIGVIISRNRIKRFVTREKASAEGLVWTSMLSLVMKRRVAQSVMNEELSMLKASQKSVTWWLQLLEAVAHKASQK